MGVSINLSPTYWASYLFGQLPAGWFPSDGPVINAVVGGVAQVMAQGASDVAFVQAQSRIQTATGIFLDACADEYLGFGNLPRRSNETDDAYRARILAEILRPRGTRAAMISAINAVTGHDPVIFEPIRDAAAFDVAAFDMPTTLVGSYEMPFRCYITVRRPAGPGIKYGLAFDVGYFDKNQGAADISEYSANITDAEIINTILLTLPAGCTAYVSIVNGPI